MPSTRGGETGSIGILRPLRRALELASDARESLETDGEPTTGTESESSADPPATDAGDGLTKGEVPVETGLTPEEYVLRGLEASGGRLRQQDVIEYTGWSAATVSRTLSEMEADGLVVRIRLGRENVVCLPHSLPG